MERMRESIINPLKWVSPLGLKSYILLSSSRLPHPRKEPT
nr:MAG TPA: bacterial toxin [Caudoviricetes sp.]